MYQGASGEHSSAQSRELVCFHSMQGLAAVLVALIRLMLFPDDDESEEPSSAQHCADCADCGARPGAFSMGDVLVRLESF